MEKKIKKLITKHTLHFKNGDIIFIGKPLKKRDKLIQQLMKIQMRECLNDNKNK